MNEFKVGLLTLASSLALIFMSYQVTTNQSGFGDYVKYRTIIPDAAGIFPKTPIKIAGINAGRIISIDLAGDEALIVFEVLKKIKISKDSRLTIKTVGFLGDKYIEIDVGEDAPRLAENEFIKSEVGGGMENLTKDASEVLKDLKDVMKGVKEAVAPNGRESPLKEIIDNLAEVTVNTRELTDGLKRIVVTNEDNIQVLLENLREATESIKKQMDETQSENLVSNLKKIGPVLDNARKITDDLNVIISDIKAGKGTVGKLLRDEEVIDQVSQTLSGVNKIVNKVDSIKTELSLTAAYNSETNNKSEFNLKIYPSPERFYLLGVTTSEIGPSKEKEISSTINGVETKETRKETQKNSFSLNVQIGRIIQNWGFRAGIIESSGGVGVDYYMRRWGSTFSVEAFDYRENLGPNLRFISKVHFWNVFYGHIGFEDLVSKADEQSITLGAGLRFTDEDLKGLIGFFL